MHGVGVGGISMRACWSTLRRGCCCRPERTVLISQRRSCGPELCRPQPYFCFTPALSGCGDDFITLMEREREREDLCSNLYYDTINSRPILKGNSAIVKPYVDISGCANDSPKVLESVHQIHSAETPDRDVMAIIQSFGASLGCQIYIQ